MRRLTLLLTATAGLWILSSVTATARQKWVDTGLHVLVDLDSIRRDAGGLVHFTQRILDMRKNPLPPKTSAYDCAKRIEYTSTADPNWRSQGFEVTPTSLGEDLLNYVCGRAPRVVSQAPQAPASPAGDWLGTWHSSEGYAYAAAMRIEVTPGGTIFGNIVWTLRVTPVRSDQHKIGMTGVERLRGTFDARSGIISMEGYEKNDPNSIIGLDRYRLFYAENGKVIGGITENHGTWEGVLSLVRSR